MVVSVKSAAGASYYFQPWGTQKAPPSSHGVWLRAPAALGLEPQSRTLANPREPRPEVGMSDLHRLLHRKTADGGESPIFSRKPNSSGYDFVFSAPKSVSIAWALAPRWRRAIESAHEAAVAATVDVLAERVIAERVGKGGTKLRPADAAIAAFFHYRCRPAHHPKIEIAHPVFADPNLHTHVVVPDIVVSRAAPNERRLKIAYTALYGRWSMALGAWYHAHLAFELRQIGLTILPVQVDGLSRIKENGLFQIEGVSPSAIVAFSARTQGARDLRRTAEISDAIEIDRQRSHKKSERLERKAHEFALEQSQGRAQRTKLRADQRHWCALAKRLGLNVPLIGGRPKAERHDQADPFERRQFFEKWPDLIEELTREEAVLQRPDFFRAIASTLVAYGIRLKPTEKMVAGLLKQEDLLVPLQPTASYNFPQWTSKTNLRDERRVVDIALRLSLQNFPSADPVRHAPGSITWTDAQWCAIRSLASRDRLALLTGVPGSGKTSLLAPIAAAYRTLDPRFRIIAAAEAWKTALSLRETCGDETYALAALFEKERHGRIEINEKCILVVDEAGLLPTKRMLQLLHLVDRSGAKLILVGDSAQLSPIGAGSGLDLIRKAIAPIELDEIKRQAAAPQRQLVDALVAAATLGRDTERQDTAHAMAALAQSLNGDGMWISCERSQKAVQEVAERVAQWLHPSRMAIGRCVALTRSHREAHHVNRIVRAILRARGQFKSEDTELDAVTPTGTPYRLKIAINDRVRFLTRLRKHDVYNGTQGFIRGIDETSLHVQLLDSSSPSGARSVVIALADLRDDHNRVRLACDYVSTVFGSQGATYDEVVVLKARSMRFRELYVALTRAKNAATVVDVHPERAARQIDAYDGEVRKLEIDNRARSLTRDLLESKRRDRPRILALDALHPRRTNLPRYRTPWLWDPLVLERQAV